MKKKHPMMEFIDSIKAQADALAEEAKAPSTKELVDQVFFAQRVSNLSNIPPMYSFQEDDL